MNRWFYVSHFASPLGELTLLSDGEALTGVYFEDHRRGPAVRCDWKHNDGPF